MVWMTGEVDPQFLMTEPSMRGLIPVTEVPYCGGVGVRPIADQSDTVQAASFLCREIVDFPSYRCNFKNVQNMLTREGARAVSSLDISLIEDAARRCENAAVIAAHGGDMGDAAIDLAGKMLDRRPDEVMWDPCCSVKRTVRYGNDGSDRELVVLDLGMRTGFLRALRRICSVTILPPGDRPSSDLRYDALLISSGPGQAANGELVEAVGRAIEAAGDRPVIAMGIGAIAASEALGRKVRRLTPPHTSTSMVVSCGGSDMLTYQNHTLVPVPDGRDRIICEGPEGTVEAVALDRGNGSTVTTLLYDPLPEFGTFRDEPLGRFLESLKEGGE